MKCWFFQRTKDRFDWRSNDEISSALQQAADAGQKFAEFANTVENWTAERLDNEMQPGDVAFFWESGNSGGLEGWGTVNGAATGEKGNRRIPVKVECLLVEAISRSVIRQGQAMAAHAFFSGGSAGTNFRCDVLQAMEIGQRLAHIGAPAPDLSRAERNLPEGRRYGAAELSASLSKDLKDWNMEPSPHAVLILQAATILGSYKEQDGHVLSQSGLLYAAIACVDENRHLAVPGIEADAMNLVAERLKSPDADKYDAQLLEDFYTGRPPPLASGTPVSNPEFSYSVRSYLKGLEDQETLDAIDLFAAALAKPSDFLARRLQTLNVNAEEFHQSLQGLRTPQSGLYRPAAANEAENITSGFDLGFRRESDVALALNRDQLALSLARIFRIAKGEFSLALLGRWGSGKTTIADRVVSYLSDNDLYRTEFQKTFGAEPELDHSVVYSVVHFNAWRYRKQPELWVWLYESFVSTFLDCNPLVRPLRTIRAGIAKDGYWAAVTTLVLLALTAVPFMWLTLFLPYGLAVFGISGLIGLFFLFRRWRGSLRNLVDRYGMVTSHKEHLGMQALVGEDLSAVVRAWSRSGRIAASQKLLFVFIVFAIALVWSTTFLPGSNAIVDTSIDMLSPDGFSAVPEYRANFAIASLIAWSIWCVIALAFVIAVATDIGRTDRILFVVDDLDRCPQDEIVDLIDGIKLMIDDKEVGQVVQAFVLADDSVLDAAIRHRFAILGKEDSADSRARWRAAVREHMEKVFLCHVSLPSLEAEDVGSLVDNFGKDFGIEETDADPWGSEETPAVVETGSGNGPDAAQPGDGPGTTQAGDADSNNARPALVMASSDTEPNQRTDNGDAIARNLVIDMKAILSSEELKQIRTTLMTQFRNSDDADAITPRSIRSFMFKYQLARMLLQSNGIPFEIPQLVQLLAEEVADARLRGSTAGEASGSDMEKIVQLVA